MPKRLIGANDITVLQVVHIARAEFIQTGQVS